ncbi:MAG: hypothetical protein KDA24_24265 [Deltaproteobacteria bacterium]|nr:hypothetical protein [Deltaproteobacteria bacterium]
MSSPSARVSTLVSRLRAWPWIVRLLLRIALTLGATVGPLLVVANWLAIGTITEAWPWFLWGEDYLALAEQFFFVARPIFTACLAVVTWWLLGRLLMPAIPRPGHIVKRALFASLGLPTFALTLVALSVLAIPGAVNGVRFVRTFPPRTNHVVMENCSHCHSPWRPQHFVRTREAWERTVGRMRQRNGADKYVSEDAAADVIDWLSDYRGFSDAWTFRARCERCHGEHHLTTTDRTAEEWDFIVERAGWMTPFAFRGDQKAQIKRYLAANVATAPPTEGSTEWRALEMRLELQRACNGCHSISLILEEGAMDHPRAMVKRMSYKDPELVPPERVDAIVEALEALPRDEASFWRLFPHDILLEEAR